MPDICAIGDVHGHLQLALGLAAAWQRELSVDFEAVLLVGDVGTFTDMSTLDKATRRHAKDEPCELEFLRQWMPGAPHLRVIWEELGLECPIIMTHGNHEGFEHLMALAPDEYPPEPVPIERIPTIDGHQRIHLLPSGWALRLESGTTVGAVGGIQPGQRNVDYHPMALIDEYAPLAIEELAPLDVLITHQGPAVIQGEDAGAESLDRLVGRRTARTWFHGHAAEDPTIAEYGGCLVVPLRGVPFNQGMPGDDAWAWLRLDGEHVDVLRGRPSEWRQWHRRGWIDTPDGPIPPALSGAYFT